MSSLTFYGAAGEVTGSKHLLETNGKKILLDCGMFQGHRKEAEKKNREFPFNPKSIDAIVLSHAHLDHCGSIPTMYAQGFRGPVYCTPATRDVAELIMLDSAHIQQSDNRHIARYKKLKQPEEPIYTEKEVKAVLKQFITVSYHKELEIFKNIKILFRDAGHILGSATVEISIKRILQKNIKIGFTGDLGRYNMPILRDPENFSDIDVLISESTYGDRLHDNLQIAKKTVKKYLLSAVNRKAKIILPAFALGRTQELIYVLHELTNNGDLPRFPIFVDSPLAINITDVFKKHKECYDQESFKEFGDSGDLFKFFNLQYTKTTEESIALNRVKGPVLIISAAGMCEAGRIRHHLKNNIENRNNMIMITGFMAKNTLGRKMVDGEEKVKIFDRVYHLRAQVIVLNAFSAHADSDDLVNFVLASGKKLKKVFLVHGESKQIEALGNKIKTKRNDLQINIPETGQVFKF